MSHSATCPVCDRPQAMGLLDDHCTTKLERELGDVAAIAADLDVTMSRQDRVPVGGIQQHARADTSEDSGSVSPIAHEKNPIKFVASRAADDLANALTHWAKHITGRSYGPPTPDPTKAAARALLSSIREIRRDPDVRELVEGIGQAVRAARAAIDHPRNRTVIFVGPCPESDEHEQPCLGDVDAFVPSSDDRPAYMQCRIESEHRWSSIQWLRAGRRILNRIEELRQAHA